MSIDENEQISFEQVKEIKKRHARSDGRNPRRSLLLA